MKNTSIKLACLTLLAAGCGSPESTNQSVVQPPDPEQIPKELVSHGDIRVDNYYWMKLSDEQKNSEDPDDQTQKVVAYLEAENEYLKKIMAHTEELQETLYQEIIGRIKQTDESVPYFKNGYWYYSRYEEGKEYPIWCRRKGSLESDEEVMLNVNDYGDKHEFVSVNRLSVSPDNKYLAYGLDTVSRRLYTILIKDLETGEMLPNVVINSGGRAAWASDSKTFFYVEKEEETLRNHKIFRHKLGSSASEDVEIFHEKDDTFSTFVYRSKSGKYIVNGSFHTLATEYRILDADNPEGEFQIYNVLYIIAFIGGTGCN